MRKVFLMSAFLTLLAVSATSWGQYGQDPGSAPDPGMQAPSQDPGSAADPGQAPAAMTAEGELFKVDPASQTIWIKASDGSERQFLYTDQTQVDGADGTVEGLAHKTGSSLRIHYESSSGADTAVKIEVL
jgi:hypothetical protein